MTEQDLPEESMRDPDRVAESGEWTTESVVENWGAKLQEVYKEMFEPEGLLTRDQIEKVGRLKKAHERAREGNYDALTGYIYREAELAERIAGFDESLEERYTKEAEDLRAQAKALMPQSHG